MAKVIPTHDCVWAMQKTPRECEIISGLYRSTTSTCFSKICQVAHTANEIMHVFIELFLKEERLQGK